MIVVVPEAQLVDPHPETAAHTARRGRGRWGRRRQDAVGVSSGTRGIRFRPRAPTGGFAPVRVQRPGPRAVLAGNANPVTALTAGIGRVDGTAIAGGRGGRSVGGGGRGRVAVRRAVDGPADAVRVRTLISDAGADRRVSTLARGRGGRGAVGSSRGAIRRGCADVEGTASGRSCRLGGRGWHGGRGRWGRRRSGGSATVGVQGPGDTVEAKPLAGARAGGGLELVRLAGRGRRGGCGRRCRSSDAQEDVGVEFARAVFFPDNFDRGVGVVGTDQASAAGRYFGETVTGGTDVDLRARDSAGDRLAGATGGQGLLQDDDACVFALGRADAECGRAIGPGRQAVLWLDDRVVEFDGVKPVVVRAAAVDC